MDLYRVASCSKLFMKLAQESFAVAQRGDFGQVDSSVRRSVRRSNEMLYIFGQSIRRLHHLSLPSNIRKSPFVLQYFNIAKMEWLCVERRMLEHYIDGWRTGKYDCFEELKVLYVTNWEDVNTSEIPLCIDFPTCFPALLSLDMVYPVACVFDEANSPRNLQTLHAWNEDADDQQTIKLLLRLSPNLTDLDYQFYGSKNNQFLSTLIDVDMHNTLERLQVAGHFHDWARPLIDLLAKFHRLKHLHISIRDNGNLIGLIDAFQMMPQLESLDIRGSVPYMMKEWRRFLKAFPAAPFSRNLKSFHFWPKIGNETAWLKFVDAMPQTCTLVWHK